MYMIRVKATKRLLLHTLADSSNCAWHAWIRTHPLRDGFHMQDRIAQDRAKHECVEVDIEVRNVLGD